MTDPICVYPVAPIEAMRWEPGDLLKAGDLVGWLTANAVDFYHPDGLGDTTTLAIRTPDGERTARPGDWIIKGVQGEFFPWPADHFAATYVAAAIDAGSPAEEFLGVALIAAERARQVTSEGYTADHDAEHRRGALALAAAAYALAASGRWEQGLVWWPFDGGFKPDRDPVKNLTRAGALVAAELDGLIAEGIDDD